MPIFLTYFLFYLIFGIVALSIGQPHEDAYIIFNYVNNFLAEGVITFNSGGAPTEGVTDFLWFMLISGLTIVTRDPAVSATLLNAVGMGLVALIIVKSLRSSYRILSGVDYVLLHCLLILLLFSGIAVSGYTGFSSTLYSAIALSIFVSLFQTDPYLKARVPLLGIVFGLFRPDGVIVLAVATVIAFLQLWKADRDARRTFLRNVAVAVIIGASYFVWRYCYFGHFLPLPLYVKSAGFGIGLGVYESKQWLAGVWPVIIFAAFAALGNLKSFSNVFLSYLPFLVLFVVMALSHQSQNWGSRFQAPIFIPLYFLALYFIFGIESRKLRRVVATLSILLFGWCFVGYAQNTISYLNTTDYMEKFPNIASSVVEPEDKIALTEAGRLPYYVKAQYTDLIGLNHEYVARNLVQSDFIETLSADVVMVHFAEALDNHPTTLQKNVEPVTSEFLSSLVSEASRNTELSKLSKEKQATISFIDMLQVNDNYSPYMLKFGGGYNHIYAFNSKYERKNEFVAALEKSFIESKKSYCEINNCFGLWK